MANENLPEFLDQIMPRELRRALQDWFKASPLDQEMALEFICDAILGVTARVTHTPFPAEQREILDQKLGPEDMGEIEVIPFRPRAYVADAAPEKPEPEDAGEMNGLA